MNILIVNHHVPYIWMLAKTGHNIFVLNPKGRIWDLRMRPIPENVKIIDDAVGITHFMAALGSGKIKIDRAIMQDSFVQTENGVELYDRLVMLPFNCPKLLLFHNSAFVDFNGAKGDDLNKIRASIRENTKDIRKVFISKFKKDSWEMDGVIIKPGFDLNEWGGWRGTDTAALTCLNNANHRDFMNGTKKTKLACIDYKHILIGEEGGQGYFPNNFDDYKTILKNVLCYIALNNPEFEDGYNLSMLEFMATGGPAVTLNHFSSPVKSGVNGFASDDLQEINKFLHGLTMEEAHNMGRNARKTVSEEFPMDAFIDGWNDALGMM